MANASNPSPETAPVWANLLNRALDRAAELLPAATTSQELISSLSPDTFARAALARADAEGRDILSKHLSESGSIGAKPPPTLGVDVGSGPEHEVLAAAIAHHLHQALGDRTPDTSLTVAALVDTVAVCLWGSQPLIRSHLLVYLRIASDLVRRALRSEAEADLAGLPAVTVMEPVNDHSHGPYAGGPREAIARDDWWQAAQTRDPELAWVYALHRFAGRSIQEIADLLGLDRATIRARLFLADQQLLLATGQA